jgi:type II secretory ATPase GspE/PulE/Tfp pilus assembly ATPase PilB-like protein
MTDLLENAVNDNDLHLESNELFKKPAWLENSYQDVNGFWARLKDDADARLQVRSVSTLFNRYNFYYDIVTRNLSNPAPASIWFERSGGFRSISYGELDALARQTSGLILVTGPTGSGKSTTLASMIELINQERKCMVISLEDPIEYTHPNLRSAVTQREIGGDTHNFPQALRHALRQDPDVILVGEMRDFETIQTALIAAETGHLVFSTLHTIDATETVNRIIAVFPPYQHKQVRIQLASVIKASSR